MTFLRWRTNATGPDAPFKTYCSPLARPLPRALYHAGDRVDQRVTLTVRCKGLPKELRKAERAVDLTDGNASGKPLPSLGFQFVGS